MAKIVRTSLSAIAAALMVLSIVVTGFSQTATAQVAVEQAYLWADQPSADAYTPNEGAQFNSAGQTNTIVRTGVGAYTLTFPGITTVTANVHVTASSGSAEGSELVPGTTCKVATAAVAGAGGLEQFVVCFNAAGEPADSGFSFLLNAGDMFLGEHGAYLWANDPTSDSYTPDEHYQYNSTSALNTVTKSEVGHYQVLLPGLAAFTGNIQVTAASGSTLGEVPAVSCGMSGTGDAGGDARGVSVRCADRSGTAVDSGFTLLFVVGVADPATGASIWARGGYAKITHSSVSNKYDAGAHFQFNSNGGFNQIQRTAVGMYTITFPNVGAEAGNVQVTAWGTEHPSAVCSVSYWDIQEGTDGKNFIVNAACYDAAGNPVDSFLWVTYVMPEA